MPFIADNKVAEDHFEMQEVQIAILPGFALSRLRFIPSVS